MAETELQKNPMNEALDAKEDADVPQVGQHFEEDVAGASWNLQVPILPCWDETDDGIPAVSASIS
jgi:hypothetical protein